MTETEAIAGASFQTADLPMAYDRDAAVRRLGTLGAVHPVDANQMVLDPGLADRCLHDAGTFSSQKAFEQLGSPLPLVPIAFDPPEQTRYRRILQPFFTPRRMRAMEHSLREQFRAIIAPLVERGSGDLVTEVADVYPTQAFLTLFGLPSEDRDQFIAWKDAIIDLTRGNAADRPPEDLTHALALFGYLTELIERRRGVPGDDILSELLALEGPDALTDGDLLGLTFHMVLAGLDTITSAIGLSFDRLIHNPGLRKEILDDPGLIPKAIEELLRIDTPVIWVPRVTTSADILGDTVLPAGTTLNINLATANRCPVRWEDPNTIDFHRDDAPHLSFGAGPHRCLGSHLARLELRIVLEEWHRAVPDYELAPGARPRLDWPASTLRMVSLPVVFPPA